MRVLFEAVDVPLRSALRLVPLLNILPTLAKDCTAYVFGYQHWHELHLVMGTEKASPLDEDCGFSEAKDRQSYQEARLHEWLKMFSIDKDVDVRSIWSKWAPSSRRPPSEISAKTIKDDWAQSPEPMQYIAALMSVRQCQELPMDYLVSTMLQGIRQDDTASFQKEASELSLIYLQSARVERQAAALRWLEALSYRRYFPATYAFAMALIEGRGGKRDAARGTALLQSLLDDRSAPRELLNSARKALAAVQGASPKPTAKELRQWEVEAKAGDAEAAFDVGQCCDPFAPESRHVKADPEKAAKFYRLSANAKHVQAACSLGILLYHHRHLEESFMEGLQWLQVAAAAGNEPALACLQEIDKAAKASLPSLGLQVTSPLSVPAPVEDGCASGA